MIYRLLLCLGLGLVDLHGQSDERPGVSVRFRALAFDEPILGANFLEGDRLRRLDIPNDAFTREVTYRGPNTLRFLTIDDETLNPQPLSAEMLAATQRLRRAQAVTLQASDEHAQITRLLHTLNQQVGEQSGPPSGGDRARLDALNDRLRQLVTILSAATKETEETNLQILRLEAAPKTARPAGRKQQPKGPKPTSTPTAEYTFQKDGSYLLLFSSAGNGHQIVAWDDADGAFPYGSFQFLNLTGKDVEIRYPDRTIPLRANGRTIVRNPASDHQYALAEIQTKAADGFDVGHVYRALQNPTIRSLVFLLPLPDEPHAIRSKTIEDRRPAETADRK